MIIITDGGKRDGVTYGSYKLLTDEGEEVAHRQIVHAANTSNEAEYLTLISAIKKAKGLSNKNLTIILDSELVAFQVEGQFNCYAENLRPLRDIVRNLLKEFDRYDFLLVKRNFIKQKLGH